MKQNYNHLSEETKDKMPALKIKKCKEKLQKYMDTETIIGVPSGDGEEFCFDVPEEEYDRLDEFPDDEYHKKLSKSFFNKNLYRIYGKAPDVPIWRKLKKKGITHLLKVEYNDYGIISIEETDIPFEKINLQ